MEIEAELVHRGHPRPHSPPDLQRFVSKRMDARTYDIDSSHVPMLSQPRFVLDVIRDAVKGAAGTSASKRA